MTNSNRNGTMLKYAQFRVKDTTKNDSVAPPYFHYLHIYTIESLRHECFQARNVERAKRICRKKKIMTTYLVQSVPYPRRCPRGNKP